jgi:hypothetical protein
MFVSLLLMVLNNKFLELTKKSGGQPAQILSILREGCPPPAVVSGNYPVGPEWLLSSEAVGTAPASGMDMV